MISTEKWKFNKYCKMYAEIFNDKVPRYALINYEELQKMIVNKYANMKPEERLYNKNILKDKILEYEKCHVDANPFIAFIFAILGYYLSEAIKNYYVNDSIANLRMLSIYSFVSIITFILLINNNLFTVMRKTVKNGFWNMCLNIFEMCDKGEFNSVIESLNYNNLNVTKQEVSATNVKSNERLYNSEVEEKGIIKN